MHVTLREGLTGLRSKMRGYCEWPPFGHMLHCLEKQEAVIKGPGEHHRVGKRTFHNDDESANTRGRPSVTGRIKT